MVLFGIGALLPWNAILTALDFFIEKVSNNETIPINLHLMYSWLDISLTLYLVSLLMDS